MVNYTRGWIAPLAAGAAAMYLFDPASGRRRRARLRDAAVHGARKTVDGAGALARDAQHRVSGLLSTTVSRFDQDESVVPDAVLEARVRSALGRATSHPGAIGVAVYDGCATLTGPVLAREHDRVVNTVSSVAGICGVADELTPHQTAGTIPGLQGESRARRRWFQESWSPTTRLLAVAAGSGMVMYGLRSPSAASGVAALAGAGLALRGVTDLNIARLIGARGRQAVDIQQTIHLAAPIEEVFRFWQHFENFPRFMTHVRQVQDLGSGRSRWTVDGPAGMSVHWDAVVTDFVPNERIAWKTEEGSPIAHAGIVRFDPNADGTTRVTVRMTYNPIAGAIGHGLAWMLGTDPRRRMIDDLVRMKTAIETGIPPRDAAQPSGPPAYL